MTRYGGEDAFGLAASWYGRRTGRHRCVFACEVLGCIAPTRRHVRSATEEALDAGLMRPASRLYPLDSLDLEEVLREFARLLAEESPSDDAP